LFGAPTLIVVMSLQLAIPWWVALQQSPLPLHQLGANLIERMAVLQRIVSGTFLREATNGLSGTFLREATGGRENSVVAHLSCRDVAWQKEPLNFAGCRIADPRRSARQRQQKKERCVLRRRRFEPSPGMNVQPGVRVRKEGFRIALNAAGARHQACQTLDPPFRVRCIPGSRSRSRSFPVREVEAHRVPAAVDKSARLFWSCR